MLDVGLCKFGLLRGIHLSSILKLSRKQKKRHWFFKFARVVTIIVVALGLRPFITKNWIKDRKKENWEILSGIYFRFKIPYAEMDRVCNGGKRFLPWKRTRTSLLRERAKRIF